MPDPEVVKSLREAETQLDQLRSKMEASMDEQSELRGSMSRLESELEQAQAEVSTLTAFDCFCCVPSECRFLSERRGSISRAPAACVEG